MDDPKKNSLHLKAQYAQPCIEPEVSPFTGRTFIRDWGKRCPICQDIFFTRRLETEHYEPYRIDRHPDHGKGLRETCGDARCWDAEKDVQLERLLAWEKEEKEKREAARQKKGQTETTNLRTFR